MKRLLAISASILLLAPALGRAQDAMSYGAKHLSVLAEDDRVRVLGYAPHEGDKTPMHSHPATVVYVVSGAKVRDTFPDGTMRDAELMAGAAVLQPPLTHADEALDDLESTLIELKK